MNLTNSQDVVYSESNTETAIFDEYKDIVNQLIVNNYNYYKENNDSKGITILKKNTKSVVNYRI